MLTRRDFLRATGSGAALLAAGARPSGATTTRGAVPPDALVFDAMGEIRSVYGPELLAEILASGLDAITVTLCDPKTFEQAAVDAALEGIRSYDRYLASRPEQFLKATSVRDVDRARREGKLAVFYLFQNSTPLVLSVPKWRNW